MIKFLLFVALLSFGFGAKIYGKINMEKVLLAYFSKDGHTGKLTEKITEMLGADVHQIEVEDALFTRPDGDFKHWVQRQAQKEEWPKIKDKPLDLAPYDIVFCRESGVVVLHFHTHYFISV
jgi:hypothetical protein